VKNLRAYVNAGGICRFVGITFYTRDANGRIGLAQPMEMAPAGMEPMLEPPPTVELRHDAAQELMDELWRIGLRPTEGTGSAGALAAVQRHLDDMRALVFKGER